MAGTVEIYNMPSRYDGKYVVCSCVDGELWYYGIWNDKHKAYNVASGLGYACVVELED